MTTVMNKAAVSAVVWSVMAAAQADPTPPVRFLPPLARSVERLEASKKDPRAGPSVPTLHPHMLTLFNVHTNEAVALEERAIDDEPALISRLLRDRTTWEEHPMAMSCVAVIRQAAALNNACRVELVSGFRSDKLNEHLRKKGHHVARESQHVLGRAIDFRLIGVSTEALLRTVRGIHQGGIGNYPVSGFVHVDIGPRRQWRGS